MTFIFLISLVECINYEGKKFRYSRTYIVLSRVIKFMIYPGTWGKYVTVRYFFVNQQLKVIFQTFLLGFTEKNIFKIKPWLSLIFLRIRSWSLHFRSSIPRIEASFMSLCFIFFQKQVKWNLKKNIFRNSTSKVLQWISKLYQLSCSPSKKWLGFRNDIRSESWNSCEKFFLRKHLI